MRLLHFTMLVSPIALTLEALVAHFRRPTVLAWRDTFTNVFIYLVYSAILSFWTAATYFIYARLEGHALFDLTSDGPLAKAWTPAPWVLLVVLEDLCFYSFHRASHRVRLLWTAHQIHHSSTYFNLSTALRQSWLPFVALPFWLPLPLLGFAPEDVLTVQLASLFFQFFLHTELVRSYGPLDLVFNSPHHHRAHHGLEEQFVDRNFGGVLILWDRLFGSFTRGQPESYGIGEPLRANPVAIQGGPWVRLARDVQRAPTWASKLWTIVGPPEFNPLTEASPWPAGSRSPLP